MYTANTRVVGIPTPTAPLALGDAVVGGIPAARPPLASMHPC